MKFRYNRSFLRNYIFTFGSRLCENYDIRFQNGRSIVLFKFLEVFSKNINDFFCSRDLILLCSFLSIFTYLHICRYADAFLIDNF